jgi:hypothetical protein
MYCRLLLLLLLAVVVVAVLRWVVKVLVLRLGTCFGGCSLK